MLNRIKSEPALVSGAVQAVLALCIAFGLKLSDVQTAAILAVTAAGLALFVRSKVSPVAGEAGEDGCADGLVILLVAILLGVVLLLFGVRFGR